MAKFSPTYKQSLFSMALFLALGIAFTVLTKDGDIPLGGFYFICAGMLISQAIYTSGIPKMVLASPIRRELQIYIPTLAFFVFCLLGYAVFIVALFSQNIIGAGVPLSNSHAEISIIFAAVMCVLMQLYLPLAFKSYPLAMAILLVAVLSMTLGVNFLGTLKIAETFGVTVTQMAIAGIAFPFIGFGVTVPLAKHVYKKDFSPTMVRFLTLRNK